MKNQGEKKTKKQKKTKCQDRKSNPPFKWVSIWGVFVFGVKLGMF